MSTDSSIPSDDFQASPDTGVRLKLLRELAGISQRELAKRAGMTNSSISTIEQGLVSPSVQSLARILAAIPISLPDFFSLTPAAMRVVSSSSFRLPQIQAQTVILPAYCSCTFLVAPSDLSGVVLSGVLTLVLSEGPQVLTQGQSFYVPAGQLFRLSNLAVDELQLFVCSLFVLPI